MNYRPPKSLSFILTIIFICLILLISAKSQIKAQTTQSTNSADILTASIEEFSTNTSSESASATTAASLASPSAEVQQRFQQQKDDDLTDTSGNQKSKLAAYLDNNPPGPLSWHNFIQYAIRFAITEGVPANIIVLVLLFPLAASFISASRHIIGLRGFGIYIPTVLSVAFVSTGIIEGIVLFAAITLSALGTKRLLRYTKMSYLPRTAMQVWMISLGVLALLLVSPILNLSSLMTINIFPILILIMLSENFLDALGKTKPADALALTTETLVLAFISSLVMRLEVIQQFALIEPELFITSTGLINFLVGKFVGLRITEFMRFRNIIEE